ncbi:hypothetical protein M427DRAFT_54635 [Gonapodya prolifera JEL478]|uniref:Uncharacterized protein n=1 Tax=Gonapodya prolifera (strain JEL478) TaxID=1344416 RepID=A0A139AKX7_GONPJ|nr:hypothetical protein M427DRAFT_54635 [Gonapodya prolifera JEL478]|eukprot:KXS17348.1 hypothetical protein M427DRAFT_54635 [Gonapodya prolifera JEL478]
MESHDAFERLNNSLSPGQVASLESALIPLVHAVHPAPQSARGCGSSLYLFGSLCYGNMSILAVLRNGLLIRRCAAMARGNGGANEVGKVNASILLGLAVGNATTSQAKSEAMNAFGDVRVLRAIGEAVSLAVDEVYSKSQEPTIPEINVVQETPALPSDNNAIPATLSARLSNLVQTVHDCSYLSEDMASGVATAGAAAFQAIARLFAGTEGRKWLAGNPEVVAWCVGIVVAGVRRLNADTANMLSSSQLANHLLQLSTLPGAPPSPHLLAFTEIILSRFPLISTEWKRKGVSVRLTRWVESIERAGRWRDREAKEQWEGIARRIASISI